MPGASINDTHVPSSMAMIVEAAGLSGPGHAALLGCGNGNEIPLLELARKFDRLDCIDLDNAALSVLAERCQQWEETRRRCHFHCSDLTGLIPQIVPQAQEVVAAASSDPLPCLNQLSALLNSAQPRFWKPPAQEKYSLVVCSAVLTQLQATVRKSVEKVFLEGFPAQASALLSYEPWKTAVWTFARALEDAFVLDLESFCSPAGIVYLSDTVHVCWVKRWGPESFTTDGVWIATRTSRLADYLHSWNEVLAERQWDWARVQAEGPYAGRIYGVQAIIYKAGSPERKLL